MNRLSAAFSRASASEGCKLQHQPIRAKDRMRSSAGAPSPAPNNPKDTHALPAPSDPQSITVTHHTHRFMASGGGHQGYGYGGSGGSSGVPPGACDSLNYLDVLKEVYSSLVSEYGHLRAASRRATR